MPRNAQNIDRPFSARSEPTTRPASTVAIQGLTTQDSVTERELQRSSARCHAKSNSVKKKGFLQFVTLFDAVTTCSSLSDSQSLDVEVCATPPVYSQRFSVKTGRLDGSCIHSAAFTSTCNVREYISNTTSDCLNHSLYRRHNGRSQRETIANDCPYCCSTNNNF